MDAKLAADCENEPFLPQAQSPLHQKQRKSCFRSSLLIHVVLIISYTVIFLLAVAWTRGSTNNTQETAINYTLAADSRFAGPRTNDTDLAWSELLQGINVRVNKDELSQTSETPVELPEGGYLAWPEAMHQIHCVKRIREWFYRDQYLPPLDEKLEQHWIIHIDHCIELLRQSVMCNPDSAWMGFHWEQGNNRPTLNLRGPEHKCIDWDQYVSNVRTRSVSQDEMNHARRP